MLEGVLGPHLCIQPAIGSLIKTTFLPKILCFPSYFDSMGCHTCSKVSDNLEVLSAASAVDVVGHFISFFHFYQYFAQILQQPEDLVKSFGGYSRSACEGGKAEVQILSWTFGQVIWRCRFSVGKDIWCRSQGHQPDEM